jgi:hypothetical protein
MISTILRLTAIILCVNAMKNPYRIYKQLRPYREYAMKITMLGYYYIWKKFIPTKEKVWAIFAAIVLGCDAMNAVFSTSTTPILDVLTAMAAGYVIIMTILTGVRDYRAYFFVMSRRCLGTKEMVVSR